MKIGPTNKTVLTHEVEQKRQLPVLDRVIKEEQKDTVEISNSGREKLKELADSYMKKTDRIDDTDQNLSKLARIKNKVEAGYYDLDDVEDKIIDKLTDTIINEINNNKKME